MPQLETGFVLRISMVPVRSSSEKDRMVMAGIKKTKNQGLKLKKAVRSANPAFKMLYSSSKTHKNKPLINKKTAITK